MNPIRSGMDWFFARRLAAGLLEQIQRVPHGVGIDLPKTGPHADLMPRVLALLLNSKQAKAMDLAVTKYKGALRLERRRDVQGGMDATLYDQFQKSDLQVKAGEGEKVLYGE